MSAPNKKRLVTAIFLKYFFCEGIYMVMKFGTWHYAIPRNYRVDTLVNEAYIVHLDTVSSI